jgi:hypothetical protein
VKSSNIIETHCYLGDIRLNGKGKVRK